MDLNPDRPGCVRPAGVEMNVNEVTDPDAGVKMKPTGVGMKPIGVVNLNIRVKMNETGVADLDVGVKMKPIGVEMKPIGVTNPDVEVKMNDTDLLNPDIRVKMKVIFHFDPDAEGKTVDNNIRMKPPGQNLFERFYF